MPPSNWTQSLERLHDDSYHAFDRGIRWILTLKPGVPNLVLAGYPSVNS